MLHVTISHFLNKHCLSDLEQIAQLRYALAELLQVSNWINVRQDAAEKNASMLSQTQINK